MARLETSSMRVMNEAGERRDAMVETGQRNLVETFSRLVHELKTPLAALRALNQGLRHEPAIMADPAAREVVAAYTQRGIAEIDRLVRLLDSFKCLSKPRYHPNPDADLREVVATSASESLAQRASQRGVRFNTRVLDEARVAVERDQLVQVLTNLTENAIRATPTGGKISVSVERHDLVAHLVIEDTGSGLGDEAFAALAAGGTPPSTTGSGIGLLVVRAIVEGAGGELRFERRAPAGTRVVVALPLVS
jgi:signal transduction histidine kinase